MPSETATAVSRVLNEGYTQPQDGFCARRAEGCWIEDVRGRRHIDLAMAGGTALLGHANPAVVERLTAQIADGTLFTVPNEAAHRLGERLHAAMPWFPHVVFCSTGSEATLRAIRLARAHTGRNRIALFSGSWHGSHDMVLFEEDYRGPEDAPVPMPKSAGIPAGMHDWLLMLPYNSAAAFDLIRRHRDELALVIIEPVQGSNPRDDIAPFLRELRAVTREAGVPLCFDEVITGGRLALGGAQERFGIQADLATYGKTMGGGTPIGFLAGSADIMATIRSGRAGDGLTVFMGGTFSANPLTMAGGLAVIEHLAENRAAVYGHLDGQGERLKAEVNAACAANGWRARMIGCGSMLRMVLTDQPVRSRRDRDHLEVDMAAQKRFYAMLLEAGVHIGSNRINFLSTAHAPAVVDAVRDAYLTTLDRFSRQSGLI